jgi:hypothetical protein
MINPCWLSHLRAGDYNRLRCHADTQGEGLQKKVKMTKFARIDREASFDKWPLVNTASEWRTKTLCNHASEWGSLTAGGPPFTSSSYVISILASDHTTSIFPSFHLIIIIIIINRTLRSDLTGPRITDTYHETTRRNPVPPIKTSSWSQPHPSLRSHASHRPFQRVPSLTPPVNLAVLASWWLATPQPALPGEPPLEPQLLPVFSSATLLLAHARPLVPRSHFLLLLPKPELGDVETPKPLTWTVRVIKCISTMPPIVSPR